MPDKKTYTAADFANAEFARHPERAIANAVRNTMTGDWKLSNGNTVDTEYLAGGGWVPVIEKKIIVTEQKITVTDRFVSHVREEYYWGTHERRRLDTAALRHAIEDAVSRLPAPTTDPAHDIDWQEVAERHEDTIKALVAERDEARESLHETTGTVKSLLAMTPREHLDAARNAGHPLPKGATIPEGAAFWVKDGEEPWEFVSEGPSEDFDTSPFSAAQYVLLDPPAPKRPDGAEEIEGALRGELSNLLDENGRFHGSIDGINGLADRLASRGVRVVSEDGAS